jgi:hypothetical protein
VRWELRLSQKAVGGLYTIDRELVPNVWAALRELAEEPAAANLQASEDDPSVYWLAVEGDVTIWLEILDERHAILIVKIE